MSFKGFVAELPVGRLGLTGNKNPSDTSIANLLIANDVHYYNGTLEKEGGASKYNSSAISGTPKILGLHDWIHDGSTQRLIAVTDNGDILKDSGSGTFATTLDSGLTIDEDDIPQFVEGGKENITNDAKLFIITGVAQVQVLAADGASTSDLATPGSDLNTNFANTGVIHEDRLWLAFGHRVYYSETTDHEDYNGAGAGSIAVFPGDGTAGIKRIMSFKGFLIVFKNPRGIYAIDTTDPTLSNWKTKEVTNSIGIAGTATAVQVEDDIIFLDSTGNLRTLTTTDQFGDIGSISIGDVNDINTYIKTNLNTQQLARWKMVYYAFRRELHMACSLAGSNSNNRRLVFDFNRPDISPQMRISDRDTPISLALQQQNNIPQLIMGDDGGFVWKLDQENRNVDGSSYAAEAKTGSDDLASFNPQLANRRKLGRFLELVGEPIGNWNISVDVYWDDNLYQTVTFNMGSDGATLGSFILGTDTLAGDAVINRRRRITGGGRRIALGIRQSGLNQNFSLGRFYLHFMPSDERI